LQSLGISITDAPSVAPPNPHPEVVTVNAEAALRACARTWAFVVFSACILACSAVSARADAPRVIYRSPSPGARYVRPESNLILRFDGPIEPASLPAFTVEGSVSGAHAGRTTLSADRRTVVFQPDTPFAWGESVQVGGTAGDLSFSIAGAPVVGALRTARADDDPLSSSSQQIPGSSLLDPEMDPNSASALPASFPSIQSTIYGTPAPGMLFMASFAGNPSITPYLMITDNSGTPMFYRALNGWGLDFKMQPNGLLTYYDASRLKFFEMDSSFTEVDSFACGNGYTADEHELRLLPNGHALLMAYDGENVDMSEIVDGGDSQADVVGCVIQELDENKNVVFQWRSWDHFQITDATNENLQGDYIDYVHGNAIEVDEDGNLLLSSRHMDEISKIDRQTGDIIWRWGGKNNQFNFLGDTLQFSHQHAIRNLGNGHYVLFDNGNFHNPPYSRAVEYVLNQQSLTARQVWEYRNTPDTFGAAMGYVQRLDNGNTLITWGTGKPNVIEVDPNGQKVMELSLPANVFTYRAYRQEWLPATTSASTSGHRFMLSANLPNPFRGRTDMTLRTSRPSPVSVRVFDTRGRELKDVVPQISQSSGTYHVQLDLTGHAGGVYLCQVTTVDGTESRRIVHLR
jgi:hypothetical protein